MMKPEDWEVGADTIDGLKSELRDLAKVAWDRGAKDYVRLNCPAWAREWDTPPELEVLPGPCAILDAMIGEGE